MKKQCIALFLFLNVVLLFSFNGTQSIREEIVTEIEVTEEETIKEPKEQYIYDILDEGNIVITKEVEENIQLYPIEVEKRNIDLLEYQLQQQGEVVQEFSINLEQFFPDTYTHMEGVITFRGNNLRIAPSFGISSIQEERLEKSWELTTTTSSWGGGAGWTGQPVIVRWSDEIKEIMNIKEEFKTQGGFTEVIYGSLGGKVYFMDLHTGIQTREPIHIKNPIKGSISIDPREYPLLYVGDGINESGRFGCRIFSLIDGKELYFINGIDSFAHRGWGAFDSSGIINSSTDTLIQAGENGILYNIKLNTDFNIEDKRIKIDPEIIKYRYKIKGNSHQGIENSVSIYRNLAYFGDNGGSIQCIDLTNMEPVWALEKSDDTDSTITIEVVDDIPYLYTGTEVDKQGTKGNAILRKINGLTGEISWIKQYECLSILGEKPNNGGVLATNVLGKNEIEDMVIFTLGRYNKLNAGLMVALDKETGEEIWKWEMPYYAWSSPVDFYNENGKGYIIQCDSIGNIYLLEGTTGNILDKINLGANIESSPAIFEDNIVVATRGGKIYGVKIK